MHKKVLIDKELLAKNEDVCIGQLEASIDFSQSNDDLQDLISTEIDVIKNMTLEGIKEIPSISELRKTYKLCGKAPSRYRSSCEAMMRRIIQGKGLYQVNTLVDVGNYISLKIRNSIGLYDLSKIDGDIMFRIGKANEQYMGIGRYELNMEGMPLLSDNTGAFGSPTSDSERTSITEGVQEIILLIFSFNGSDRLEKHIKLASDILSKYCNARNIVSKTIE
ncbi:MAG: B3/4 domain-containing protein [Hyphomicrobiales bacterium]